MEVEKVQTRDLMAALITLICLILAPFLTTFSSVFTLIYLLSLSLSPNLPNSILSLGSQPPFHCFCFSSSLICVQSVAPIFFCIYLSIFFLFPLPVVLLFSLFFSHRSSSSLSLFGSALQLNQQAVGDSLVVLALLPGAEHKVSPL